MNELRQLSYPFAGNPPTKRGRLPNVKHDGAVADQPAKSYDEGVGVRTRLNLPSTESPMQKYARGLSVAAVLLALGAFFLATARGRDDEDVKDKIKKTAAAKEAVLKLAGGLGGKEADVKKAGGGASPPRTKSNT